MSLKQKIIYTIFILMALSSSFYGLQYIGSSYKRAMDLSSLSPDGRQLYVEYEYKYLTKPYYEYVMWLNNLLPDRQTISLLEKTSYMYYYPKLNYQLYPKYIAADVHMLYDIDHDKLSELNQLDYGNVVFAISPDTRTIRYAGVFKYIELNGHRFYIVAEFNKFAFLAIRQSYLQSDVINHRENWYRVFKEFSILYPGHSIKELGK